MLIVDDDGDVRDVLTLLLVSHGATVRAVASATEALDAIHMSRPDVLLADIGLPEEDGYSLIRTIRAHDGERNAARLALAVSAYATLANQWTELGVADEWPPRATSVVSRAAGGGGARRQTGGPIEHHGDGSVVASRRASIRNERPSGIAAYESRAPMDHRRSTSGTIVAAPRTTRRARQ